MNNPDYADPPAGPSSGPPGDADARWSDRLLGRLQALLADQLDAVRRSDFDEVLAIGRRIDDLAGQASGHRAAPADAGARDRICRLQGAMELAITERLSQVRQARTRLRRGSKTLQAYRHGAV